ncbi:MAG: nucleotide exchange factor GrpE [Candidatus Moranbacteria bacterium]|nr:nucleotide exchange factor GrpE [Candidatus Moranbacteria bacterium]
MTEKNEEKKFHARISQKIFLYNKEKNSFLLVKMRNDQAYFAKKYGVWELPGGTMENGEVLLIDSLKREIREEIGEVKIEIVDTIDTFLGEFKNGPAMFLIYLVKYISGEIELSDEHMEFRWETAEKIISGKEYGEWLKQLAKKASKYLENQNALDSWKRCQADFENYKKDQAKHQEEFRKYAKMDVIEQILPVVDNFEASLAHVPEKNKENGWVEGIVYIKKQLENVLKNNDIEEIQVKVGDKFNPEIHEAVGGDGKKQKITKIVQKGYRLNGRIVRAARVEVS